MAHCWNRVATAQYRDEEFALGEFVTEACESILLGDRSNIVPCLQSAT